MTPPDAGALGAADVIAFAPSSDLDRARRFYEGALGLRFVEQNDFACVFDANGTMLRITAVQSHFPADHTILGWRVADITHSVKTLTGHGISFERFDGLGQDEDAVWSTPGGDRVAWFKDPDGNTLSLTQTP